MFEPFEFSNLQPKNAILYSPLVNNSAQKNGAVSQAIMRHYINLAKEGTGAIIIESAYVAKQGKHWIGQLGISNENHLIGLEKLVQKLKQNGALVGIRLSHAGAKTSQDICGEQPLAPSVINFGKDYDTSREFDREDCEEIVLFFIHAAERAQEVGADFVEINGAQQLLLDQCLSYRYNTRDDEYGNQDIRSRLRLSTEILQGIRNRIPNEMPISYLFSIHDKVEDGFTIDHLREMVELLEQSGVDIFHPTTIHVMNKFFDTEDTFIEWVAKFTNKPLIAEGNIKSPQVLKEVYQLQKAKMYALDKALFSRQQWYPFLKKKML